MNDIGVPASCKFSNARRHCSINLAFARDEMRLESFFGGSFMKLQIWVGGVRKDSERARVRPLVQGTGQVEDDGLRAVHPATTDDVQNLHVQQLPPRRFLALFD